VTVAATAAAQDRRSSAYLRHVEIGHGVMTTVLRNWAFAVLWLFVFTIPWEAAVEELGSIGTLSRTVGLLAVPLCLVAVVVGGRRKRLVDTHIILVSLATWTVASMAWSIDIDTTLQAASTMIQLLVMVVVLWEFCADDQRRSHLQWAFVLGAMIGSVAIFQAALTQDEVTTRYIRVTEGGLNENYAAFVLSIAIPVAWHLSLTSTKALHRWVAALYIPVGIVAVVLTGSRGGLFTLFLALSFLPMTLRRGGLRSKAFALVLLAISVFVVAKFVPPQTIDRLETIPAELTTGDLSAREQAWEASWAIFASNPIVGVGAGA
jgi:hypothetical protein